MGDVVRGVGYDLYLGRMETVLSEIADGSVDSVVTDSPYGLRFMGKAWDYNVPTKEQWQHAWRVLKPGGYLLNFSSARTYHRMVVAVEDAGFEIRDQIMWIYGSGFPKSHNLDGDWKGWGTALKPAHEPIVVARKPLEFTNAKNMEVYGTGAMNIDACRIEGEPWKFGTQTDIKNEGYGSKRPSDGHVHAKNVVGGENGRWPANVIHDGSEEVLAHVPEAPGQLRTVGPENGPKQSVNTYGDYGPRDTFKPRNDLDKSAARFFYCAKTSPADRNEGCEGNNHPTVKPTDLMQYLIRLVTRRGGVVLDPFMGSGSTGKAAILEHCHFIGIDDNDVTIAQARIEWAIKNRDNQLGLFV